MFSTIAVILLYKLIHFEIVEEHKQLFWHKVSFTIVRECYEQSCAESYNVFVISFCFHFLCCLLSPSFHYQLFIFNTCHSTGCALSLFCLLYKTTFLFSLQTEQKGHLINVSVVSEFAVICRRFLVTRVKFQALRNLCENIVNDRWNCILLLGLNDFLS